MFDLPFKSRVVIHGDNFKCVLLNVLPVFEASNNVNLESLFIHLKRDILSLARYSINPQNRDVNYLYVLRIVDIINQTIFKSSEEVALATIEKWAFFSKEIRDELFLSLETSADNLSYFFSYDYINRAESCNDTRENLFSQLDILVNEVIRQLLFSENAEEGVKTTQHGYINELILKSKKGDVETIHQLKEKVTSEIYAMIPEDVLFNLIKNYDTTFSNADSVAISKFIKVSSFLQKKRANINSMLDNIQIIDSMLDLSSAELTVKKMINEYSLYLYQALLLVDTFFSKDYFEFGIVDQYFEQQGAYKSQTDIDLELSLLNLTSELKLQGGVIISNLEKINLQLQGIGADLKKTNSTLTLVLNAVSSLEETMYSQIMGLRGDLAVSINRLDNRLEKNLKSISSNVNTGNIISFIQTLQLQNIRKSLK